MPRKSLSSTVSGLGAAGRGEPLPAGLRARLERGFGTDLSRVRVHTSPTAGRLARALGADAFTIHTDIYFRDGQYQPGTRNGWWLLAHEVAHVVQQAGGKAGRGRPASVPGDLAEQDADRCADLVLAGRTCRVSARVPAPAMQCHASFEHRTLGDVATSDLVTISTTKGPDRDEILRRQIGLADLWQFNPRTVTKQKVHDQCPWIRTLTVGPERVLVTYGEVNALPDYLSDAVAIDSLGEDTLLPILQVIRQEGHNQLTRLLTGKLPKPIVTFAEAATSPWALDLVNGIVETADLDEFTRGLGIGGRDHYQGLLARNACHFAPFSWYRWQASHLIARDLAMKAFEQKSDELARQARVCNGYADHFLQDSFAAGHLVNKTLVMEWFVEWAASRGEVYVPDWDVIKNITFGRQPGLAGLNLYDATFAGPSNDPQTAQEAATLVGRVLASTVVPDGQTGQFTAYQNYLTFLTSAVAQIMSANLHDYYNSKSLWVTSPARPEPFEIWGDVTLLSGDNGGTGVQATSETTQLSQGALEEIINSGHTEITTEQIRQHFPTMASKDRTGLQDLKTWTLGQKSFCEETFDRFLPRIKGLIVALNSPRLGVVSQDQGFACASSQSLPGSGYHPVNMLVRQGRVFAGTSGYVYEVDPVSGKVLQHLRLATAPVGGETRLAADDEFLYAGVYGYVYAIDLEDWRKPVWTVGVGGVTGFQMVSLERSGHHLYAGTHGYVYDLDPATGKVLRSLVLPTTFGGDTRIAADDEYLYAGVNYYAYGIKLTDWSKPAWNARVSNGHVNAVSVLKRGDHLFTGGNGFLRELDPATGEVRNKTDLPTMVGGDTRIAADDEYLYAGVHGYAYAVKLANWSKLAWDARVGGTVTYDPVSVLSADGKLFAGSDGYVYDLDPATGTNVRPPVLLTYLVSGVNLDTRLAADGPTVYAGVNGYANKLQVSDDDRAGTLHHSAEDGGGFGDWTANFDQAPVKMRAVAGSRISQSTELFAIGVDSTLYHDSQNSGGWQGLTPFAGAPEVMAVAETYSQFGYDVFAIATDGTLYHNYLKDNWRGWTARFDGAPAMQAVTCFSAGNSGECHVFAIGTDGALYHDFLDGNWHGWTRGFDGAPAVRAVAAADDGFRGRSEVFAIGIDGILYHNYYTYSGQSWHGWEASFDGSLEVTAVIVVDSRANQTEVLTIGTDGTLYRDYFDGSWHGWTPDFGNAPKVTLLAGTETGFSQDTEAFAVSTDGTLYHNIYDAQTARWGDWNAKTGTGAPIAARALHAIAGASGSTEVFAVSDR